MESATRTAAITPERYTEVTAVFRPASSANRVYVSVETLDGTVLPDRSSHYAETAFADGGVPYFSAGVADWGSTDSTPDTYAAQMAASGTSEALPQAFLTRSHSLPFLTSSGMAFFTSSGSLPHASITTAKPGVGGISEHRRFCSCCADFVLVMLPGFDSCKAFSFPSSTGESFVRSCDCMGYASICPGFDRFCPGVNCAEMVEAAGIEPNTTH